MAVKFRLRLNAQNHQAPSPRSPNRPSLETGFSFQGRDGIGTVILVHGLTGTPHEMKGLGTFLNRQGYAVLCPRLANHGEPIEILSQTTWEECYRSVQEALRSIDGTGHSGPIFISGLSMGALLALLLAEEFPSRIAGVSCLSPTLFYDGWNVPWTRYLLPLAYSTPLKRFFYFKEEPPYGIKNQALRQRIHRYYDTARLDDIDQVAQYGYPCFPVSLLCELHFLVKHLSQRLRHITTPVQLIQANDDDMTSVKNSQFIYNRIRSDVKELVLLYDSYHIITADQERDLVARNVGDFFNRVRNDARSAQSRTSAGSA